MMDMTQSTQPSPKTKRKMPGQLAPPLQPKMPPPPMKPFQPLPAPSDGIMAEASPTPSTAAKRLAPQAQTQAPAGQNLMAQLMQFLKSRMQPQQPYGGETISNAIGRMGGGGR